MCRTDHILYNSVNGPAIWWPCWILKILICHYDSSVYIIGFHMQCSIYEITLIVACDLVVTVIIQNFLIYTKMLRVPYFNPTFPPLGLPLCL